MCYLCLLALITKLQLEKTGAYADRAVIWRDTRLKPDGEYKNPSVKIIGEAIVSRVYLIHINMSDFLHYVYGLNNILCNCYRTN